MALHGRRAAGVERRHANAVLVGVVSPRPVHLVVVRPNVAMDVARRRPGERIRNALDVVRRRGSRGITRFAMARCRLLDRHRGDARGLFRHQSPTVRLIA